MWIGVVIHCAKGLEEGAFQAVEAVLGEGARLSQDEARAEIRPVEATSPPE